MIYVGFALFSRYRVVLPCFATVWLIIFLPNMLNKDASMSRYGAPWQAWVARSGFLFPYLPALLSDLACQTLSRMPADAGGKAD